MKRNACMLKGYCSDQKPRKGAFAKATDNDFYCTFEGHCTQKGKNHERIAEYMEFFGYR